MSYLFDITSTFEILCLQRICLTVDKVTSVSQLLFQSDG